MSASVKHITRAPLLRYGCLLVLLGCWGCISEDDACLYPRGRDVIAAGDTAHVQAGLMDPLRNDCMPYANDRFRWVSSDTTVLRAYGDGTLQAVAPGTADLLLTSKKSSTQQPARYPFLVIEPVAVLRIRPEHAVIAVGDTIRYEVGAFDSDGRRVDIEYLGVNSADWSLVGRASATGLVGSRPGSTDVLVSGLAGRTGRATLVVVDSTQTPLEPESGQP